MITKSDGVFATSDLATDKFKDKYGNDILVITRLVQNKRFTSDSTRNNAWLAAKEQTSPYCAWFIGLRTKMSTRKGNTIWLEDVIEEAETRASKLYPIQR